MEKHEAVEIVAVLEAAYPNHPTRPETPTAYWMALGDLPYPVVSEAARIAMMHRRFFPTPAEIREIVAESLLRLPTPADAWAEVRRQMKNGGIYGRPAWSCEAVRQAVASIGWRELCLSPEASTYERDAFIRAYESYRERAVRTTDLAQIAAAQEAESLPGPRAIREGAGD